MNRNAWFRAAARRRRARARRGRLTVEQAVALFTAPDAVLDDVIYLEAGRTALPPISWSRVYAASAPRPHKVEAPGAFLMLWAAATGLLLAAYAIGRLVL